MSIESNLLNQNVKLLVCGAVGVGHFNQNAHRQLDETTSSIANSAATQSTLVPMAMDIK